MVEQDVARAQVFEDVVGLAAQVERLRCEGRILQIRPLHVAVEEHHARKVHRAIAAKHLVLFQLEIHAQPLDDVGVGAGFDLQAHRVALAPVVQLHANRFEQRARLFLLEVEVGVAGHAKGGVGQHFVAAVHAGQILRDQVLQEQVVELAVGGGQANEPRQGARHGDHTQHLRAGTAPLGAQQQRQAEGLVQHARKGMRRVDRDRSQQRVDFALEVVLGELVGLVVQFIPFEQPDALLAQFGQQAIVPAGVLGVDKAVDFGGQRGQGFVGAQPVVARLAVAVFDALHEAGLADFDVFVEVAAGDGQELDPLQQGIGRVLGLFQDAPVELHPGCIPSVEKSLLLNRSHHRVVPFRSWQSTAFPRGRYEKAAIYESGWHPGKSGWQLG